MLKAMLHRIVAQPRVYDFVQTAVGANTVRRRLAQRIKPVQDARWVVDIGGGTGAVGELWSPATQYVCLDIDPLKLQGFLARNPTGLALLGDAAAIPLADQSVDVVLCTNVTHHLTEHQVDRMIAGSSRILRPGGKLILSDAIWAPQRKVSRLLWKYDRGHSPRTPEFLRAMVERHMAVETWEQLAVWHEYFICVAAPK